MKRARSNQAGFSIVEAVIVVAVVGIIGAAGLFVYQHNRVNITEAAASPNQVPIQQTASQSVTSNAPASTKSAVNIPELGINITVPADIKDLIYQVSTVQLRTNQTATIAKFSTQALTNADSGCSAAFGPLGSLERVDRQYPVNDPNAAFNYGQLVKQFSTFFISAGSPNAACSTNASALATASQHKSAFVSAEASIQSLN